MANWTAASIAASVFGGPFGPAGFFFAMSAASSMFYIYFHGLAKKSNEPKDHRLSQRFLKLSLSLAGLSVILAVIVPLYIWHIMETPPGSIIPPPPVPAQQTAWITNQTPYFIELDSSGKYSSIFEKYLSSDLQSYDPNIVTNISDAAVILKVGDVSENSEALYSDSVLEETPAYDTPPPQSTIAVHLTLQRVDGSRAPFDGDFTCQKSVSPSSPDNNPGEVDTLAQKDIAFSIYQYLVGKTDKLTCSP